MKPTHPLIVAPMAGGPSSVELVAAASEAGALGSVGAAYLEPDQIRSFVAELRRRTARRFAINLFAPEDVPTVGPARIAAATHALAPYRAALGLVTPPIAPPYLPNFDRQFAAVLELRPAVLSFIFGLLPPACLAAARAAGIFTLGTATTPEEARRLEAAGVDGVILQGVGAGGHRGIFDPNASDPGLATLDLVRAVRPLTRLTLAAAGGIMTAADVRAARSAGADFVQLGTAFLATREAATAPAYRARLLAGVRTTRLTRAFSGRLARGLVNRFITEVDARVDAILPFPIQNAFTRDLRGTGDADFLSLWCGDGGGKLWTGSAADLIDRLVPK